MNTEHINEVVWVILTYNQSIYLPSTLTSVFNQTARPSELLIMDDASTDDTEHVVRQLITQAPSDLTVNYERNEKNIGLMSQLNKLVGKYQNKLIIFHAGDDEAYPHRLETTYREWVNAGKPMLVLGNFDEIDSSGKLVKPFNGTKRQKPYSIERLLSRRAMVYGCCAAISSELLNFFGPIPKNVVNEDRVNAFRALLIGRIHYIHQALLRYRVGVGISSFLQQGRDAELQKLKRDAQRELIDLECHKRDALQANKPELLTKIEQRKRYVEWIAKLNGKPTIFELCKAFRHGINPSAILRVRRRLKSQNTIQKDFS